jgi:4-amino-4-deoxy-L-arabinose transferase-like glycosyltransferase
MSKISIGKILSKAISKEAVFFLLCLIAGLILRLYFMWHMPFTNDEGAYLYDAKTLLEGRLPGGDVLTKSPVAIILFSFFAWVTHGSLYAARLVSLFFSLATLAPILAMVFVWQKKNWPIATAVWLIFSAPVVLTGFGHTEAVACFFAGSALALFVVAFFRKNLCWLAALSGISFVLALGARKINLVLIIPLLIFVLQKHNDRKSRNKIIVLFLAGLLTAGIPLCAFVFGLYGWDGIQEFVGLGYVNIASHRITGNANVDIWGLNILETLKIIARVATAHVVLGLLAIISVVAMLISRKRKTPDNPIWVLAAWLGVLVLLYSVWPTFLPDYAVDFLLPVTLLGVFVVGGLWGCCSLVSKAIIVGCFLALNILSYSSIIKTPWTGMFDSDGTKKMAAIMQEMIPAKEAVLTAATIVPYLSGHHTYYDISHPLWYRYEFISEKEKGIFLPPWDKVSSDVRQGNVKWILMEHLTDYAYFRNTDQLINLINQDWELVATVPNNTGFRSNTLKLYKIK